MHQILTNKNFRAQYKQFIKPFIHSLHEYTYKDYDNDPPKELKLDNEIISHHLQAALILSINNNSDKYISFINNTGSQKRKTNNYNIINDKNFNELYSIIGLDIFNNNISEIIENGFSERLIKLRRDNPKMLLGNLTKEIFEDNVWNIIQENPSIGDTTLLDLFGNNSNLLLEIINKNLIEGIKYTYENIPESHNFITTLINNPTNALDQFSTCFINNIGDEVLKKIYNRSGILSNELEFQKLFAIASVGNYELIQDIVNFEPNQFSFSQISKEDMSKKLLESNIPKYQNIKREIFLYKYFGIPRQDIYYIKLFLNSINQANNLSSDFTSKYEEVLQLLNQVFVSNEENLIKASQTMDVDKKEQYKKIIYDCEKEGNNLLRAQFIADVKERSQQIMETAEHKTITTNEGKEIDVYELTGQPFTMLVHAITHNYTSSNDHLVDDLINAPENWNNIESGNNYISTSLISNQFMTTYHNPRDNFSVMFGFDSLPRDSVAITSSKDLGINRKAATNLELNMRQILTPPEINTISTVDEVLKASIDMQKHGDGKMWNEIVLRRTNNVTGEKIKPDYIVCMDGIFEPAKKAASYFNIPIYVIQTQSYIQPGYTNNSTYDLTEQVIEHTTKKR